MSSETVTVAMEEDARYCARYIYEDLCRGRRHWSARDLFDLIGRFGVELLPVGDMPRGCAGWYQDGTIGISARLSGQEYLVVLPHELGHHLLETERYSDLNNSIDGSAYDLREFNERVCTLLGEMFAHRGRLMDERDLLIRRALEIRSTFEVVATAYERLAADLRTAPDRLASADVCVIMNVADLAALLDEERRVRARLDELRLELN